MGEVFDFVSYREGVLSQRPGQSSQSSGVAAETSGEIGDFTEYRGRRMLDAVLGSPDSLATLRAAVMRDLLHGRIAPDADVAGSLSDALDCLEAYSGLTPVQAEQLANFVENTTCEGCVLNSEEHYGH